MERLCWTQLFGESVLRDRPLVGRAYESAIISGAFCGFAMGATATAIANMQAPTRRHGRSPQAFVIVPIVGAFFIDLINLTRLCLRPTRHVVAPTAGS